MAPVQVPQRVDNGQVGRVRFEASRSSKRTGSNRPPPDVETDPTQPPKWVDCVEKLYSGAQAIYGLWSLRVACTACSRSTPLAEALREFFNSIGAKRTLVGCLSEFCSWRDPDETRLALLARSGWSESLCSCSPHVAENGRISCSRVSRSGSCRPSRMLSTMTLDTKVKRRTIRPPLRPDRPRRSPTDTRRTGVAGRLIALKVGGLPPKRTAPLRLLRNRPMSRPSYWLPPAC
jgi:hypothetical protein